MTRLRRYFVIVVAFLNEECLCVRWELDRIPIPEARDSVVFDREVLSHPSIVAEVLAHLATIIHIM